MGNAESGGAAAGRPAIASVSHGAEVDAARREDDFWYSVVEQVSPYLPAGVVFRWNKDRVRDIVLGVSDLDPDKHWDFRAAGLYRLEGGEVNFPPSFARRLLALDDRLRRLRFRLVPARVKEDAFWNQYFEQVVIGIVEHVRQAQGDGAAAEDAADAAGADAAGAGPAQAVAPAVQ